MDVVGRELGFRDDQVGFEGLRLTFDDDVEAMLPHARPHLVVDEVFEVVEAVSKCLHACKSTTSKIRIQILNM